MQQSCSPQNRGLGYVDLARVFSDESLVWGKSIKHMELLASEIATKLEVDKTLQFPIGGMFVCSNHLFSELGTLWEALRDEIPNEPIQLDGEVVHFFERLVGEYNRAFRGELTLC